MATSNNTDLQLDGKEDVVKWWADVEKQLKRGETVTINLEYNEEALTKRLSIAKILRKHIRPFRLINVSKLLDELSDTEGL